MNPWNESQRAQLSDSMRGAWARKSSEARQLHGAAISAGHRLGRKRHPVMLKAECFDRLRMEAKLRNMTTADLAVRLIEVCINDGIVDAVLDDERLIRRGRG